MSGDDPRSVYRGFVDALNLQDLDLASALVKTEEYQEDCVGFTGGFVGWPEATRSLERIWRGIPDLRVELDTVASVGTVVLAHGRATGTALGRLYGAPATKRSYEASFFDRVRVEDGLIVHRVQQADALGQMRQLYGRVLGSAAASALLWRL